MFPCPKSLQLFGEALYANNRISLRVYADRIVVTNGSDVIATHERSFARHIMVFDPWHYLALLDRKPGALRNGIPFKRWSLPRPRPHKRGLSS